MRTATEIAADPTIQEGDVIRPRTGKLEYLVTWTNAETGEVIGKGPNGKTRTFDADAVVLIYPAITPEEGPHLALRYDRVTCSRCGGSGEYPSSAWNGVCLGCSGSGRKLTTRGDKALQAFQAAKEAGMTVRADEIQVGDKIEYLRLDGRKTWYTVAEIADDTLNKDYFWLVCATKPHPTRIGVKADSKIVRWDHAAQLAALDAALATGGAWLVLKD